jgi:hypothetical protein
METPWYQQWGVWRRIILFVAGAVGLALQNFSFTVQQVALLTYVIAVLNLLLSMIPDAVVARVTGLKTQ